MNWTMAVLVAVLAAMLIVTLTATKPQRQHIYWCSIEVCATSGRFQQCQSEADACSAFKAIQLDI